MTDRRIGSRAVARFQLGIAGDSQRAGRLSLAGRLTIPYLTPTGPWLVKYRCTDRHNCKDEGHPKYIYDDSRPDVSLFNAQTLLKADRVVVCEGELDAITVETLGIPAVAYPGVDTWRANPHWQWCFDSVAEIFVVADGDEPGEKAAGEVFSSLRKANPDATVHLTVLPDGQDPNSFITSEGPMAFLEQIDAI